MSPTTTAPGGRSRLPSLTGLRFLAALGVFLFHSSLLGSPIPPNGPVNPFADPGVAAGYAFVLGTAGFVGVSFFFVLSGFVLTWASRPGEPARTFLRRRIVKIYPNHAVVWAISLLLFARTTSGPTAWFPNLLLAHGYFPQGGVNFSVNAPSWSLCAEMLFYASFPFLIGPLRRIPVPHLWYWAIAMVTATFAVQLVNQLLVPGGTGSPISSMSEPQFWFGYLFPPTRMFEFLLGALLALLVRARRWPRMGLAPAAALLLAGYVTAMYAPAHYAFVAVTIAPVGVLIATVANADLHGRRTLLSGPVPVRLGEMSFAFYICQGVTVFYLRRLFPGTSSTGVGVLVLIGLFAATLLGGWLLHSRVEQPMMRHWSRARRPGTPAPAPRPRDDDERLDPAA